MSRAPTRSEPCPVRRVDAIRRGVGWIASLAVIASLASASTAVAFETDLEAHVVLSPDGQSVATQAQEWLRNYPDAIDSEWNLVPSQQPSPTPVAAEAAEDLKTFKAGLTERFLPRVRQVIPIASGAVTAYEVCSAFITPGCWLFSRDDTSIPAAQTPQWHSIGVGAPTAEGCWGAPGSYCYAELAGWNLREFMYVYPNEIWGEPWNGSYHCYHANPPNWGTTLRTIGDYTAACYHGVLVAPPDGYDYHSVKRGVTVHPGFDVMRPQADDPTIPNRPPGSYPIPFNPNWPSQLAQYLNNLPASRANRIRDYIGSQIRPDLVRNPYRQTMSAPDCGDTTYTVCTQRFRDAGFTGTLTREVATFEAADVTKPAAAVLETRPGGGAEIYIDQPVVISTNPDDADMPRLVPELEFDESYDSYDEKLRARALVPVREVLPETEYDYSAGSATSVSPGSGTRVHKDSEVRVTTNPDTDLRESTPEDEERCRLSTPLGSDPAPSRGRPPLSDEGPLYEQYMTDDDPNGAFKRKTGDLVTDLGGGVDTFLRWGWTDGQGDPGFGYRHIAAKHGWAVADQLATRTALNLPPVEVIGTTTYVYDGPDYPGLAGAVCKRRVVVQTRPTYGTKAREIITSYGRLQG